MEAMCIVFVFAALVCLGLLSPFLYAAAAVLPMAANLLGLATVCWTGS